MGGKREREEEKRAGKNRQGKKKVAKLGEKSRGKKREIYVLIVFLAV